MPDIKMGTMGIAYSTPELAIKGGLDYFYQEEENVYVCPVFHPSGVEYVLKKEKDIICTENCLKIYELGVDHRFTILDNAIRAISYFKGLGKKLIVKKKTEEENGYKYVKYYYLCST